MKVKLVKKKNELPGVISFYFEPAESFTWKAGQFVHYVFHHESTDNRGSDRWFTNSAAPFENHLRITTRITDERGSTFKKHLNDLPIGKSIEISYVEGDFTVEDPNLEYVFIAGGIGITPFRSILTQLDHEKKPINVTLLYANRDKNIVYKDDLEAVAANNPNFNIHYIFSPEHINEEKIREYVSDLQKPIFYISGPLPMVDALGQMLKKMGIAKEHLKQDWFLGYPSD